MYCSVNVDHGGMAAHLTKSDCDGFKCCIFTGMDGTDYEMLWNKRMGMSGVSLRRH
jgi:hypothetical protein